MGNGELGTLDWGQWEFKEAAVSDARSNKILCKLYGTAQFPITNSKLNRFLHADKRL